MEGGSDLAREAHPAIVGRSGTEDRKDFLPPRDFPPAREGRSPFGIGEGERFLDVVLDRQDPRGVARLDSDR